MIQEAAAVRAGNLFLSGMNGDIHDLIGYRRDAFRGEFQIKVVFNWKFLDDHGQDLDRKMHAVIIISRVHVI